MTDTFTLIAAQRTSLADHVSTFSDPQWDVASLCAGWRTRDVLAHLVMPFELSTPAFLWKLARKKGHVESVSDDFARRRSSAPTGELISVLRAHAHDRFTPPGAGPGAPLTDLVVHGLDIGVPLGSPPPASDEAINTALSFLTTKAATRGFVPKGLLDGLQLATVDTSWRFGEGLSVKGPARSLILALTGRSKGFDGLVGDGVDLLSSRVN